MRHYLHFLPATIWFVIICGLYGMHQSNFPTNSFWELIAFDKIIHLFLFAYWSYLLLVAFYKQIKWTGLRNNAMPIMLGITLSVGILFELLQGMIIAGRHTEFLDVVANCIGPFLGMSAFRLVYGNSVARE